MTQPAGQRVVQTRWVSRRNAVALSAALTMGAIVLVGQKPSLADDGQGGVSAKEQVQDLVVCYARGTDAIGSATTAVGGQPLDSTVNLSVPKFAEGLAFYRGCFARDFSFTLKFGDFVLLTVPDPGNPLPAADPALQWAKFVNNAFRGPAYSNTQHLMGSIIGEVHGNTADVQSYLIATHSYGPMSLLTGVSKVGGTYNDVDVRVRGRWLIQERTLTITSSVHIPAGL